MEDIRTGVKDSIPYDKLMLATGSRPNVLPLPGNDLDGIFTISNLHKAIEIKERLSKGREGKAVVIGGGAIGIEMAEAMTDLWGVETTIVEFMPQLLPLLVNRTLSSMVEQHLREHDVTVYTQETARQFEGDDQGHVCKVITNKREIEADLAIMAVGVRPNGELARDAGLLSHLRAQ